MHAMHMQPNTSSAPRTSLPPTPLRDVGRVVYPGIRLLGIGVCAGATILRKVKMHDVVIVITCENHVRDQQPYIYLLR